MIDFTIETPIDRAPHDVFAYVSDPTKLATWQTNTVSAIPDGPIQLGTRIREVHRAGRKELPSVVEVSTYEPDRAFGLRLIEGPLPIHSDITLEPTTSGTLLRFRVYGQPHGTMRLAQPVLRMVLRRQFTGACAKLKAVLER